MVGLSRYGNGKGQVFDSIFNSFEYQSEKGYDNFDDIFVGQNDPIVNLSIVARIEVPSRRR